MRQFRFSPALPETPAFTVGDGLILLGIATLLYAGLRLAFHVPAVIARSGHISLSLALPWYALLSVGRMAAAYFLSLLFSLFYGYAAARNRTARTVLMPVLDVLQSVPILSFLPVVLLSLSAVLPQAFAAEFAAIVLIFTSQAWNMTFSFYQSMTTIPTEMREAAAVFRFDPWLRFKAVELPFAAMGLLWNSMMSWSGGWFFLMAAEIFNVGSRDFRLPGLGSYLQTAANEGNLRAVILGVATLVLVIVLLDQFVWRPLIAWTDKFKVDMVEGDEPPRSWFLDLISRAWVIEQFGTRIWRPFSEWVDRGFQRRTSGVIASLEPSGDATASRLAIGILTAFLLGALYGGYRAATLLGTLPGSAWADLGKGIVATFLRVMRCTRDYFDLDHSGRRVYRHQSSSCRDSPANRASGRIHSGDGAFPRDVAGAVASAGRFKHRRCAPHADGNAVVFAIQCDRGCGGYSARFALHHRSASPLFSGSLADVDLAGAFSIHHHRSHHGERRRVECKYRS